MRRSIWIPAQRPAPGLVERRNVAGRVALLRRVSAEFEQLPGLSLTQAQARVLFGLRADVCARVLNELVQQRILGRRADGQFVRRQPAA